MAEEAAVAQRKDGTIIKDRSLSALPDVTERKANFKRNSRSEMNSE